MLKNFDDILKDYKGVKCKENHWLAPQHPFRMVISGPSGCGKTNLLMNMLMNKLLYFDKLYIFAKDLTEDKYRCIRDFFKELAKEHDREDDPYLEMFSSKLSDIPDPDSLDEKKEHLLIFDDMVTEKDQGIITQYYIRGRKRNASMIYLSQIFTGTPMDIRKKVDYIALFAVNSANEMDWICRNVATDIPKKLCKEMYEEVCNEPYQFLFIDKRTKHKCMKYRKGFDGMGTSW